MSLHHPSLTAISLPSSSSSSSSSSSFSCSPSSSSHPLSILAQKLTKASFLCSPLNPKHSSYHPHHRHSTTNRRRCGKQHQVRRVGMARCYMEQPKNPFVEFLGKIQGSLPVIGLLSRLLSDEGGVAGDRVQFPEFCRRVQKACTPEASSAFFEFEERHGSMARPQYVLIWCWAAAVGAGLLKSDEIMIGALRLRASYDIQYEIELFNLLMDTAANKREKSKSPMPDVPMIARVEKALDAICKCCIGPNPITDEDIDLLDVILSSAFPTVNRAELLKILRSKRTASLKGSEGEESKKATLKKEVEEDSLNSMAQ